MGKKQLFSYGLVVLGYLAIALLATYPLILHINTHLFGLPGDGYGALWSFWWNMSHPINWVAPAQPTLLASARLLGSFFNAVTTYNLLLLLTYPLAGLAIYLIVSYFTDNKPASWLAGLIYILGPYHVYQSYVHLSLAMIAWLPFYFYALLLWLKDPKYWRAVVSGLLLSLVILDNYYYGYFALLLTAFFVVGLLIQIGRKKLSLSIALSQGIIAICVTAFVVGPFIIPSFFSGDVSNYARPIRELFVFRAQWWDFFVPAITHPLFGGFVHRLTQSELAGSNYFERTLYLGFIPIVLALFGVYRTRRSWLTYLLVALLLVSMYVATAPSWLATWLYQSFPTFRVYSRFGVLSLMAISILAGIGIASISSRTRSLMLYLAIGLIICVDFYPLLPAPLVDVTTVRPFETVLSRQPTGKTIVYPLVDNEFRTSEYLSDSRRFNQPLFNSIDPMFQSSLIQQTLLDPTSPKAISMLHQLHIRYVVVRKDVYKEGRIPPGLWPYYDPDYPHIVLPAWNDGTPPALDNQNSFQLLYQDSQAALYRVD